MFVFATICSRNLTNTKTYRCRAYKKPFKRMAFYSSVPLMVDKSGKIVYNNKKLDTKDRNIS